MVQSNWIHLDVERIAAETDNAFLCVVDGDEHWIPKSQIADPETYSDGDENCTISITEWIANKKGLGQ